MSKFITGIHHISLKPENQEIFEKTVALYRDILGLNEARSWKGGAMLDTGAGYVEIMCGEGSSSLGAVNHFALTTDHVDELAEKVRAAGYQITVEPRDAALPTEPPTPIHMGFFVGPCGELVELFQEK